MLEVFSRSWALTKLSWRTMLQDKELLLFPFLGGLFSLLYVLALIYPTIIMGMAANERGVSFGVIEYVVLFFVYLGLAFLSTFFNVCVVYTTKTRFAGGDATFMDSIKFAFSRIHQIFLWSLVSATVGLLLAALDRLADRVGGIGEVLINLLRSALGLAWSVITVFVIPAMVYKGTGPIESIKSSVEALKDTWGESLVRHFGLAMIRNVVLFIAFIAAAAMIFVAASLGSTMFFIGLISAIMMFVIISLVFSVLNSIFNTALYEYANTGTVPGLFPQDAMQSAFRNKG